MDILDLCAQLHADRGGGRWSRCCTSSTTPPATAHLIAVRGGEVIATGTPEEVVTAERVEEIFDLPCRVMPDPETGTPLVIPKARR